MVLSVAPSVAVWKGALSAWSTSSQYGPLLSLFACARLSWRTLPCEQVAALEELLPEVELRAAVDAERAAVQELEQQYRALHLDRACGDVLHVFGSAGDT